MKSGPNHFFHRQDAKEDKFSDQKIEVFIFLGVLGVLASWRFEILLL
jgi:hypothetical protein